jgi:WD40 repeat protein
MIHSISWAKDDSALITASADFTAKVWHLPVLPGPPVGSPQASMLWQYNSSTSGVVQQGHYISSTTGALQQHHSSVPGTQHSTAGEQALAGTTGIAGGTWLDSKSTTQRAYARRSACSTSSSTQRVWPGYTDGLGTTATASLGETAAAGGVSVSLLQHTCFVYAAEMHPTFQPLPTVVTAGFDGVLRLWDMEGVVLCSLMVSLTGHPACPGHPALRSASCCGPLRSLVRSVTWQNLVCSSSC